MESKLNEFEILNKLGEGSFGQVYKVKRKVDKQIYVMKQINISKMNQRMKNEALNEANILSKIDSSYIVKYYESFIEKQLLCIVMEFCEGGDLHKMLKMQMGRPLNENQVWRFLLQILMGLAFLHKNKILHRDIKTMNIFLSKDQVRIGDLGVAKLLNDQNNFAKTMVGTPYYLSPEMCEEKPYNEKSDIWALGCVIYELCTFKHPFEANNQGALVLKIIRGRYEPIGSFYSKELSQLIDLCLQKDYRTRPDAFQLIQHQSCLQAASNLRLQLNLYQVHPHSKHSSQSTSSSQQIPQTPVVKTKEIVNQQPTVQVIVKNIQPVKPLKVKVNSAQPVQLEIKGKQEPVRETPIIQKKIVQIPPQSAPSNPKVDDFYKDWRDKVQELQKPKQSDDKITILKPELLKQEFSSPHQPQSAPQSSQSQQHPNIFSAQQVPPTKKPVVILAKGKATKNDSDEKEKKRIRKGAPKEQARQVNQPMKKNTQLNESQKKQKQLNQAITQEEADMVLKLPEVIPKENQEFTIIKPKKDIIDLSAFIEDIPTTKLELLDNQHQIVQNDQFDIKQESFDEPTQVFDDEKNDSDKGAYTDPEEETEQNNNDDTIEYQDEVNANNGFQTIQEEQFEDTLQQTNQFVELILDNKKIELNKQLLEAEKRKMELEQFLIMKRKECIRDLGDQRFDEIINFLRTKLNSQEELNDKDQEEIDDMIQNKLLNTKNPQVIYVIYKILHFEIEITKSIEKIADLSEQLAKL